MDSFPQILFSVWESKTSGLLLIKNEKIEKKLTFLRGDLAIDKDSFDEKEFLKYLLKNRSLDGPSVKKCEARSEKKKTSLLAALLDLGFLAPQHLWENMEAFVKRERYPLFDLFPLTLSLVSEKIPSEGSILFTIPTLGFIREGIYRMKNFKLIDSLIPKENEDFQKLSPGHEDQIDLQPFEEHLIQAVCEEPDPRNVMKTNTLGEKHTKKTLFALFCLGILGPSPMATPNKPLQEFSAVEIQKILDTFNAKCAHIHKSVSKELGPVALNLIQKSIDDIKPNLSQHFQNIRLEIDGKIDLQSVQKANIILSDREKVQSIIKSLNEILAAEILAVKKNLGSDFESSLIKSLENIGG
jgi:hypothetical protein